jgi:hypothetical protein
MSKSRAATPVHSFLERLVKLANYEVTPYGSINPWKDKPNSDTLKTTSGGMVTIEGQIRPGIDTPYAINGMDILIDANTMIVGDLALGVSVRVKVGRGGSAKTVVVTEAY